MPSPPQQCITILDDQPITPAPTTPTIVRPPFTPSIPSCMTSATPTRKPAFTALSTPSFTAMNSIAPCTALPRPPFSDPHSQSGTPEVGSEFRSFMADLWEEGPYEGSSEWKSFTTHFTQEFELLKGEVDNLRSEVRNLKKSIKDLKVSLKLKLNLSFHWFSKLVIHCTMGPNFSYTHFIQTTGTFLWSFIKLHSCEVNHTLDTLLSGFMLLLEVLEKLWNLNLDFKGT